MSARKQKQSQGEIQAHVRIEAKRATELWIYSFADMYMILVCFFVVIAAIYAAKAKELQEVAKNPEPKNIRIASAGRGPAHVTAATEIKFQKGSTDLMESAMEDIILLSETIKNTKNLKIEIEGYSDSEPLKANSPFSSNLELSNIRAVRVAEFMMKEGVPAKNIRTFSYGNAHHDGNSRKVVIKIYPTGDKL